MNKKQLLEKLKEKPKSDIEELKNKKKELVKLAVDNGLDEEEVKIQNVSRWYKAQKKKLEDKIIRQRIMNKLKSMYQDLSEFDKKMTTCELAVEAFFKVVG